MEYTEEDSETQVLDDNDDGDDGWMYTHSTRGKDTAHDLVMYIYIYIVYSVSKTMEEIAQTIMTEEEEEAEVRKGLENLDVNEIPDLEDIPDIDDIPDMDDQVEEEEDPVSCHY
jgi:ubiquitin-like-conjugating enzyme ATG3